MRIDNFAASAGAAGAAVGAGARRQPRRGEGAPLPDAPAAASRGSGYGVQLGAFSSAERANEEWKKLQADARRDCSTACRRASWSAKPRARRIYRLQAEVRDEAQARAICGGLKVANKPCVPVHPARATLTEARQLLPPRACARHN